MSAVASRVQALEDRPARILDTSHPAMRKSTGGRLAKRLAEKELAQVLVEHTLLIALLALVALLALAAAGSKAQDLLDKLGRGLPPIAASVPGNRAPAGQMPAAPRVAPGRTGGSAATAAEPAHAAGGSSMTSGPSNVQAPAEKPGWTVGSGTESVAVRTTDTTLRAAGN
jgi:hypothetical protein